MAGSGDGVGKITMESTGNGLHLISMALFMATAAAVYLFLLNRVLIQIRDARRKSLLIRAGGLLSWLSRALWAIYGGNRMDAGSHNHPGSDRIRQVRRLIVRRRCAGAPPVEVNNGGVSWRKPNTTTDLALERYVVSVPTWHQANPTASHTSATCISTATCPGILRGGHAPRR